MDFLWYFYQNLTCIFVDDLNCMDFRAALIRMRGFVFTDGWMAQTTSLWQQRQLKVTSKFLVALWKSELKVA